MFSVNFCVKLKSLKMRESCRLVRIKVKQFLFLSYTSINLSYEISVKAITKISNITKAEKT